MNDDGEVAGSGYALTASGLDIYAELEEILEDQRNRCCYRFATSADPQQKVSK